MTPAPGPRRISAADAIDFAAALLSKHGVSESAAREVGADLVASDLEGIASHGLMLLPMYLDRLAAGSVSPKAAGRIVSEKAGAVVYDAENGLGQVTARRCVQLAIARSKTHALGAVAVRNAFHFGTAGRWAAAITEDGCVGVVLCNTRPLMPPTGGAERLVGNNPIAIAAPSAAGEPLVVDLALSAAAMGKIRMAEVSGNAIPPGWAADAEGAPTTDPAAAIKGMLLPAAGPKGFGLAMMIDLLAGGLSSGAVGGDVRPLYGDPKVPYACAHYFLAIDVAAFRPVVDFTAVVEALTARVRTSKRAPGVERVLAPGDPALETRKQAAGFVTLESSTVAALETAGAKHAVYLPA
jgi:LDH2 family malate/lactate/ureidoglycolate dehydrogenase